MVKITYTLEEGQDNTVKLERAVEDINASDNEKLSSVKVINLFTDCLEASMNQNPKKKTTKKKGN